MTFDPDAIRARIAAERAPEAPEPDSAVESVDSSTDLAVIGARMFGRASDLDADGRRMFRR